MSWSSLFLPPELPQGHVHLWRIGLEGRRDRAALWQTLDDDERRRAEAFYRPEHGERFAAGRGVLRRLVAAYTGLEPGEVPFSTGPFGKPEWTAPQNSAGPRLSFNLSHCEDLGLVAFARSGQLGIDVERVRSLADALAIARRNFSADEVAWLTGAPPREQAEVFFRIWTRKEAVLKAVGAGMAIDLQGFSVVPVRGEGEAVSLSLLPGAAATSWRWHDLRPAAEFQGCLVSDREIAAISTFEAADGG